MKIRYMLIFGMILLGLQSLVFAQAGIDGKIVDCPEEMMIGERYEVAAESNADRVRFEIWLNNEEIFGMNEKVRDGVAKERIRLSSRTESGNGRLVLLDEETREILDERKVIIISKEEIREPEPIVQEPVVEMPIEESCPVEEESSLTGLIVDYPSSIMPRERYELTAESNVNIVRFEIWLNNEEIFGMNERVRDGIAKERIRLSSRVDLGRAKLLLLDYESREILDEKNIIIGDPADYPEPVVESSEPVVDVEEIITFSPIIFRLPDFPDDNRVMEGDWVKAGVENGIPESLFGVEVIYNNDEVVYQHGFAETNPDGKGFIEFQMPYRLLKDGHDIDGLIIRLSHGGIEVNYPFTLKKGLEIIVPSEIKEGEKFSYEVRNSAGETAVKAGISYDAGRDIEFSYGETDGSGNAVIEEEMEYLITNGAERDGAEFWVETKGVKWYFRITIIKGDKQVEEDAIVSRIEGAQSKLYPVAPIKKISSEDYIEPEYNSIPSYPSRGSVESPLILLQNHGFHNENLHKFQATSYSYSNVGNPYYARLNKVVFKTVPPPGAIREIICAEVEIYSNGKFIDSRPSVCNSFYFKGSQSLSLVVYAPSQGPIVRVGSTEIKVKVNYFYYGPMGDGTMEGGHNFGDSNSLTDTILEVLRCSSDDPINIRYGLDPCDNSDENLGEWIEGYYLVILIYQ